MTEANRIYYHKLIRDNVPAKLQSKGIEFSVDKITDPAKLESALLKKVLEEATELAATQTNTDFIDEYCDLIILLETILKQKNISLAEIEMAKEDNLNKKGAYTEGYYLNWTDNADK